MHDRLLAHGYPLPTTICAGMHLIYSSEEKFCKLDGVVSLASFKGQTRWFACSGILIEYDLRTSVLTSASLVRSSDDENKIIDNLQLLTDGAILVATSL
uniref:Uncharacterized protein n=1 Tax=Arundo donax TaxID=35708 RepID=A0A0A9F9W0_ARUDO